VLRVNFAQPMKIKGGQQGWSHQPVWADADAYMENQMEEEEERVAKEDSTILSISGGAATLSSGGAHADVATSV